MPVHSSVIIQDPRPKFIQSPLSFISGMGQWACRIPFCLSRSPNLSLWSDATMQPIDWRNGRSNTCRHPNDTQLKDILIVNGSSTIVCKIHRVKFGRQYIASMYNYLHAKGSRSFSFRATSINGIWAINNVGPSHFSTFSRQFTPYTSIHKILIYVARLILHSLASWFSSIAMMHHKQLTLHWQHQSQQRKTVN